MRRVFHILSVVILAGACCVGQPGVLRAQAEPVRAVLFFSPTCPHCHQVINEDLPVIFERFGGPARVWVDESVPADERVFYYVTNGRLAILLIDASRPAGGALYDRASAAFAIPRERMGVPRLIIGDSVLVGSIEIPTQFPALIQTASASGGQDWPALDGLAEHIPSVPTPVAQAQGDSAEAIGPEADTIPPPAPPTVIDSSEPVDQVRGDEDGRAERDSGDSAAPVAALVAPDSTVEERASTHAPSVVESSLDAIPREETALSGFDRDPLGNGLAVVVLLAMILSVFVVSARAPTWRARQAPSAIVPALAGVGALVAGYLSYVEASGTLAVCGPVGDCNAVQQSPYANVFGIPVGFLGLVAYMVVIAAWIVGRRSRPLAAWGTFAQLAIVFCGVVFSIYLTFLEPFVIGATCLWCLSSAIIMTVMLWLLAGPGTLAWEQLRSTRGRSGGAGASRRPAGG